MKLYVIQADLNGEILYKIGFTKRNVEDRIKQFKTGNPGIFKVKYVFESDKFIPKIEKRLHTFFGSKRVENEWFLLEKEDLDRIPKLFTDYLNIFSMLEKNNTYLQDL